MKTKRRTWLRFFFFGALVDDDSRREEPRRRTILRAVVRVVNLPSPEMWGTRGEKLAPLTVEKPPRYRIEGEAVFHYSPAS